MRCPIERTCVWLLLAACGASHGRAAAPPSWFEKPPQSGAQLVFVGDATQAPEESIARDLAIQKAMHALTVYVGASVKSDFKSEEKEQNGQGDQTVSLTVDVAGTEMTINQARVKQVVVQPSGTGFDAYAMVEWPRTEYDAFRVGQKERGERALRLFTSALTFANALELPKARAELGEAERVLPAGAAPIPLDHGEYKDTEVLRSAMAALRARLEETSKERHQVCAVGVVCTKEGKKAACNDSRIGVFRAAVSQGGRRVATEVPSDGVLDGLLSSGQLIDDPSIRSAGCIVAVRLTADLLEAGTPFTFVRYGARSLIYDTETRRIVWSNEIPPTKMGHTTFDAAMNKGFDQLEKTIADQIVAALGKR